MLTDADADAVTPRSNTRNCTRWSVPSSSYQICLCFSTQEHLDNDPHVQLGPHVDRVEQHHDHHDKGAELVPERVVHDDEDGGGDPSLVLGLDPKGDIVEADHVPTHPKRLCPPRACKVPALG